MINAEKHSKSWDDYHENAAARILVGVPHETVVDDSVLVWAWQEMTLMQEHIEKQNKVIEDMAKQLLDAGISTESSSEAV